MNLNPRIKGVILAIGAITLIGTLAMLLRPKTDIPVPTTPTHAALMQPSTLAPKAEKKQLDTTPEPRKALKQRGKQSNKKREKKAENQVRPVAPKHSLPTGKQIKFANPVVRKRRRLHRRRYRRRHRRRRTYRRHSRAIPLQMTANSKKDSNLILRFVSDNAFGSNIRAGRVTAYVCYAGILYLVPTSKQRRLALISLGSCSSLKLERLELRRLSRPTPALQRSLGAQLQLEGASWYVKLSVGITSQIAQKMYQSQAKKRRKALMDIYGNGRVKLRRHATRMKG